MESKKGSKKMESNKVITTISLAKAIVTSRGRELHKLEREIGTQLLSCRLGLLFPLLVSQGSIFSVLQSIFISRDYIFSADTLPWALLFSEVFFNASWNCMSL